MRFEDIEEELCAKIEEKDKEIERLNNRVKQLEKSIMISNKKHSFMTKDNIKLRTIINELEHDFERKIQSCTIGAETTTNDFYCRLHIATLTKWLNKIKELKGSNKE